MFTETMIKGMTPEELVSYISLGAITSLNREQLISLINYYEAEIDTVRDDAHKGGYEDGYDFGYEAGINSKHDEA